MKLFFEILRKERILTKEDINTSKIESLSITKIIDLAECLRSATENSTYNLSKSIFRHSTSSHLSGGQDFCNSLECRIDRLDKLARFATLYSDQVYIHNFFQIMHILKVMKSLINQNLEKTSTKTYILFVDTNTFLKKVFSLYLLLHNIFVSTA